LISSSAGGGEVPIQDLALVAVPAGKNELLAVGALSLQLPRGSTIERTETPPRMTVHTRHSDISFQVIQRAFQRLDAAINQRAARFYHSMRIEPGMWMFGFEITMQVDQRPFARFSQQAKREAEWAERLGKQIDVDFSWDRVKNVIIQ
jgi:hypothetical protein